MDVVFGVLGILYIVKVLFKYFRKSDLSYSDLDKKILIPIVIVGFVMASIFVNNNNSSFDAKIKDLELENLRLVEELNGLDK